ncbi:MAG: hypothetical protein K6E61_01750 [Bacteroidales bacterium]|nr:hypothetical protein [Bacteroidales bacterium]
MMLMAIAAIASCEKQPVAIEEPEVDNNGTYIYTINASVPEETDVKSDYDASGNFSWSSGDAISVLFHNGEENKFFTLTTTGTGASASFSGDIDNGYEIGASDGTDSDKKIWALFPASVNHTYTAGSNPSFYVNPSVDFSATHFSANVPMCALNAAEGALTFENIACTYKFIVTGIQNTVNKVRFTIYNQTTYGLSGSWPIDDAKFINYNHASPGSANSTLSYVSNVVSNQAVFYVSCRYWGTFQPVITITNEATGVDIKTFTANNPMTPTSKTTVKPLTLNVSDGNYYAPAIDIDGVFNDWDGITEYDGTRSNNGSNSRINHWRVTSDALNIYVYLELNSEKITEARYIYVGFNTDNDTNTGTARGSIPGCEQYAVIYPAVAGSDPLEMIQGADPRSTVNGSSDGSLRTWCVLGNPSSQLELCIPRSKVGLSSAGTIKVGVSYDNYDAKEQSLTLE